MDKAAMPTDADLLAALAQRLDERRVALDRSAEILREMQTVNQRLEAAEQLKGRFLSNIRNEINNPLTTLRGFAEAIAQNPDLPRERVVEMAAVMLREVGDLSFQMQNIFAAADLEAGALTPEMLSVDVGAVLAEVVRDLQPRATQRGVNVTLRQTHEILGETDAARVALIVTNLLRNAIDFAASNVEVAVQHEEDTLCIEVSDDGPGVKMSDAEKIFDRFEQLSVGSTKQHAGHGLGLSVAQACAELLGGQISLRPPNGAGARFQLELPLQPSTAGGSHSGGVNQFLFSVEEAF